MSRIRGGQAGHLSFYHLTKQAAWPCQPQPPTYGASVLIADKRAWGSIQGKDSILHITCLTNKGCQVCAPLAGLCHLSLVTQNCSQWRLFIVEVGDSVRIPWQVSDHPSAIPALFGFSSGSGIAVGFSALRQCDVPSPSSGWM